MAENGERRFDDERDQGEADAEDAPRAHPRWYDGSEAAGADRPGHEQVDDHAAPPARPQATGSDYEFDYQQAGEVGPADESRSGRAPSPRRSRRGFAAMDPERQRRIASMGGRASGGFRSMDRERQREIARKGGQASGGFASMDPERQREIARKGGRASHRRGRGPSRKG